MNFIHNYKIIIKFSKILENHTKKNTELSLFSNKMLINDYGYLGQEKGKKKVINILLKI